MKCVICQQPTRPALTIKDYKVFECFQCCHRMTSPKDPGAYVTQQYSDHYFFGGGAGYPNYLDERARGQKHGRYYGKILARYIPHPGRLLDVGCAAGFILQGLIDSGWEGYGVEPNERLASYGREDLGLQIKAGTIETFTSERKYNLVCLIQILGHLVNPHVGLGQVCDVLSPGGYVLVETWNWKSLTARFFGKHWHEYDVPSVLHWFSRESLNCLFEHWNFRLVATGHPWKWVSSRYARHVFRYRYDGNPIASIVSFFLGVIPDEISLPYPSEDVFWALFQRGKKAHR